MRMDAVIFLGLCLTGAAGADAADEAAATDDRLACHAVPGDTRQLCILATPSPHGPFDDVVFYSRTMGAAPDENRLVLLSRAVDTAATFDFLGFSPGGSILAMTWASEGHQTLYFYDTRGFLAQGGETPAAGDGYLGLIDDYAFDHLDRIMDDGQVIYAINPDILGDAPAGCMATDLLPDPDDREACHRLLRLGQ